MIGLIGGIVGSLFGGGAKTSVMPTDPLERQERHAREMAEKQAVAAMKKMEIDTNNAIEAGKVASSNLLNNALSTLAKEIRY